VSSRFYAGIITMPTCSGTCAGRQPAGFRHNGPIVFHLYCIAAMLVDPQVCVFQPDVCPLDMVCGEILRCVKSGLTGIEFCLLSG
jgi:hypothetical protein